MTTNGDDTDITVSDVTATMDRTRDVLANWPYPPDGGWTADDLDLLPQDGPNGELDLFKRVELIDGALILMSPQRNFHEYVISNLRGMLKAQAPEHLRPSTQMTIRIDKWQRPDPDVLVVDADASRDMSRTAFHAKEVHLVIEVVSPESEHRDIHVKPKIYARAGIRHFWIIEEERGQPVVHVYELDEATSFYSGIGIFRDKLELQLPFPIAIKIADLLS
ncbi:Uma2 family endonuclease [Nonomuraea endophytica]|uniref:Uma2 family endonuclease n=1 Tax=Nonomuraea endophytica TaxID=714136 RepID=UPI0037C69810